MKPNVIVRVSDLGASATKDSLQVFLTTVPDAVAGIKFVDIDPMAKTAFIRFDNEGAAKAALTALQANDANVQRATGNEKSTVTLLQYVIHA